MYQTKINTLLTHWYIMCVYNMVYNVQSAYFPCLHKESVQIQKHAVVAMNRRGESLSLNTLWTWVVANQYCATFFLIGQWCPNNIFVGLAKFISIGTLYGATSLYHSTVVTERGMCVSLQSELALKMARLKDLVQSTALDHDLTFRKTTITTTQMFIV